jgi:microcystin-dependent protein
VSALQDMIESVIDSWMRGNVHTIMPGEIVEVTDREVPLAFVQPSLLRVREGAEAGEAWPVIPDVPIVFPTFGDFGIAANIDVGTPVLLLVSERAVATWMNEGGVVDPALNHTFDIGDCFALPGLINFKIPMAESTPAEGIVIRKHDGTTAIRLSTGKIEVHNEDSTITIDGSDVTVQNPDCSLTMSGQNIEITNGVQGVTVDTSTVKAGAGSQFVALSNIVDSKITAINAALVAAIAAAVPTDGGAAALTALQSTLSANPSWAVSTASYNLKAE